MTDCPVCGCRKNSGHLEGVGTVVALQASVVVEQDLIAQVTRVVAKEVAIAAAVADDQVRA